MIKGLKAMVIKQVKHVIIIGAAFSGLSAAYHIIRDGFDVTVVEAANEVSALTSSLLIYG
jgi:monoamine oxidase